ncbi:MAG: class I SAM-dependent methyltransferase [Aliarcobacter sp.]|jgi:SAM-dependent methyltransferase|nr:class I SAM-dependent methyltransferase [Aliarcobacter sp.]
MPLCPLCLNSSILFYKDEFYLCSCCEGIFRAAEKLLDNEKEKQRYESHTNDSDDLGYQNFVAPITNAVLKKFSKDDIGLDFGCGKDSPIVKVLRKNEYEILEYDPFFFDDKKLLEKKYDYIACCEVIEHFYNPKKEFELLKKLLKEDGILYLMTGIYNSTIDFSKWWYKNDPTHVFIFQEKTFEYIKKEFDFKDLKIEKNFIKLSLEKE